MNTSNDSLVVADKHQDDTTTAPIIADNDIFKFFNIEKTDIQEFKITLQDDALYIRIKLNAKYHQCPVCGQMTKKIKDYTQKKIVHSILSFRNCYIL